LLSQYLITAPMIVMFEHNSHDYSHDSGFPCEQSL